MHRTKQEGESLLLPFLVEQLRSSLLLDKASQGKVQSSNSYSRQSSGDDCLGNSYVTVEDSGTESGEDLKLLAVGLRDSIQQQRSEQKSDVPESNQGCQSFLGPGLLAEVQTALSRLQASLKLSGELSSPGESSLDPERREALLQLVSRLQASLRLPPPPWNQNDGISKSRTADCVDITQSHLKRFSNKKKLRQNRYTVGVTQEELADARRLIEENSQSSNVRLIGDKDLNCASNSLSDKINNDSFPLSALLLKRGSAGDIEAHTLNSKSSIGPTPAQQAFRPIHFAPNRSKPNNFLSKNINPKPYPQMKHHKSNDFQCCPEQKTKVGNFQSQEMANSIDKNVDGSKILDSENSSAGEKESRDENITNYNTASEKIVTKHLYQPNSYQGVGRQPMTAVVKEFKPGRTGEQQNRPQKSSQSNSPSSTPQRSDSGSSVLEKAVPCDENNPVDLNRSCKDSATHRSDSGSHIYEKRYSRTGSLSSSGSNTHSKASTPLRSDSGGVIQDEIQRRKVSLGESSINSKSSTPSRSNSESVIKDKATTKTLSHTISLDENEKSVDSVQNKGFSHSLSLDSTSSDYDPSVLLFTPAQSMQIAIHKAAINKQLSEEGEKRNKLKQQISKASVKRNVGEDEENDDASSEGSYESDSEVDEEVTTIKNVQDPNSLKDNVNPENIVSRKPKEFQEHIHDQTSQRSVFKGCHSIDSFDGKVNNLQECEKVHISESMKNNFNSLTERDAEVVDIGVPVEPVSSAQRLLQMATDDQGSPERFRPRGDRKQKMKRANTIDIPQPLNFYTVDDESDYSSDCDYGTEQDGISLKGTSGDQHRAAYLALRGPIRVGNSTRRSSEEKVPPPNFQPKTDSDRKFLAFLQQHNNKYNFQQQDNSTKTISYNPSARGGHHWSNRFSNIKTVFETPSNSGTTCPKREHRSNSGPAAARLFWQSADDSVGVVKPASAAANGPRLSRQGSIFLRKLFEQKEQEKNELQSKLPWTDKNVNPDDGVVVGSLTVANPKTAASAVLSKKQVFTQQAPITQAPIKINKFSHAPMSAFKPIEKKVPLSKKEEKGATNQPWATPSISGTVKQLAAKKFTPSQQQVSNPQIKPVNIQPSKPRLAFTTSEQSKTESTSPLSPVLPWIKDNSTNILEQRILNTAVAKFENMSRETSPQPIPPPLPRSKSMEKIALPSFTVFTENPPEPPPRAYVPPPNTTGIVQGRLQEKNIFPNVAPQVKPPPTLPAQPMLIAPNLVQTFDSGKKYDKKTLKKQQEIYESHQHKYGKQYSNNQPLSFEQDYGGDPNYHYYDDNYYHESSDYEPNVPEHIQRSNPSGVQTYSAGVNVTTAVYPNAYFTKPYSEETSETASLVPKSKSNISKHPPPLSLPLHSESSDITLPSPEAFTAVSHVMKGPISHQAVTVSHKTRHRYDEEGLEEKNSAARNLSNMIHKFKMTEDSLEGQNLNIPTSNFPKSASSSPSSLNDLQTDTHSLLSHRKSAYERSNNVSNAEHDANSYNQKIHCSTEEFHEDGESVLTTRLQIPVYNNVSGGKTQDIMFSPVSNALCDKMIEHNVHNAKTSPSSSPVSPSLRKSESWHQLAPGQSGKGRRPQSLVLPDLPVNGSTNRRSPGLVKAKSSHSLAFPKQFEAAIEPNVLNAKQRQIEAYLAKSPSESRAKVVESSVQPSSKHSAIERKGGALQKLPVDVPLLDDSLENVEEAFEDLFNSSTAEKSLKTLKSNTQKSKRATFSKTKQSTIYEKPQSFHNNLSRSKSSSQFQHKQKVWEESSAVKTRIATNLATNDNASK